jgi:hypothetical protein
MVGATSRTRTVTLPEHLSSNPVFIKVLVAQSVFVCICLVFYRLLSFCPFFSAIVFYILVTIYGHYVIECISDLRQVSGFLWVLRFPPPIKLTATI